MSPSTSSAPSPRPSFSPKRVGWSLLRIYLGTCVLLALFQRKLLYFPTQEDSSSIARNYGLKPWILDGERIGFVREAAKSGRIWLLLHGNGGQAVDRVYALPSFAETDTVYILEYPGYGGRAGSPSKQAFNAAAKAGYDFLRRTHPDREINIFGESIGSGAACSLAALSPPPDRIALVVPFDKLASVAQEKLIVFPIRLMLFDQWDNIEALSGYNGRVDIYGAAKDIVIPVHHAKALAAAIPQSRYHPINCGHNEWADGTYVNLR